MLAALHARGTSLTHITTPAKWCVYSKACLTYSDKLVSYLARYTRKGAMSESRLVSVNKQSVSFKYRHYADKHSEKVMTLSCVEFLRRYLLHVLPKGFMRIRHYGFLANACYKRKLALIKAQGSNRCKVKPKKAEAASPPPHWPCEVCKIGVLRFNEIVNSSEETMKLARTS